MHVQLWQMLLIIAYGFFINYDKNGTMIGTSQPVTAGLIVGLIMGDLKTGLYIGATLQLMTLGISSLEGLLYRIIRQLLWLVVILQFRQSRMLLSESHWQSRLLC